MAKVQLEDLKTLFEQEKVLHGQSRKTLGEWGGIEGLMKSLRTSPKTGISKNPSDQDKRAEEFGRNDPIVKEPTTIVDLILQNFEDEMLRILCISAVVSLVLGIATEGLKEGWLEGASILIAVVIIVTVTAGNNYIKEQQFQKLNAVATQKDVQVIRDSNLETMSVYKLLVGDIVHVETGEIISVDGILIEGHDVAADESALTGEPDSIKKEVPVTYGVSEKKDPFLRSGSKIVEGSGIMVVAAVGIHSVNGQLKLTLQQADDKTPLQEKLGDLADRVGQVGIYSAAATFSAMFLHYLWDVFMTGDFFGNFFTAETLHEVIEYFIIAVSIIVVAVPEGLPLSVTIALAYSVGKMREQNNLVRYLQACQTMGGANNICSDKTGTLTKNLMTVTKIFIEEQTYGDIDPSIFNNNTGTCEILCESICNNTSANPDISRNPKGFLEINQKGNKTECALLQTSYVMGYDYKSCRNNDKRKKVFPFSSEKKMMGTIYERKPGQMFAFIKGAPDFIIPCCTHFIDRNGKKAQITEKFRTELDEAILSFARESLRTILLVYKDVNTVPSQFEEVQNQLIIIGLVGIKDPLRDGIPEAVKMCESAGVKVRMVTGDNKNTAVAIAKEAGILSESYELTDDKTDYRVLEGYEFRELCEGIIEEKKGKKVIEKVKNLQKFKQIADQLQVLARSSPKDKFMLATGLKQIGEVVAMTGDGTNDAPALKKADIGFAMGIAGTQVAKEASGIILLDDNFRSIVTAMKWGRNIFDSIRKFLQFQLTVNFVALVMAFVGGAVLRESPLNPIQMLWVNLIMDTLASLALATEPPSDDLLKRKPYSRRESLITANMWKNIIAQGCLQILILGVILFKGPDILGIPSSIGVKDWNEETGKHYSIFFNVFVLLQVFNEINARKLKAEEVNVFEKFFNNTLFIVILVSTVVIQLTMIKYGGKSMKTIELSFTENLLCIVLGSTALLSGLIVKVVLPRHLVICPYGIEVNEWKKYWKEPPTGEQQEPEAQEEGQEAKEE